MPKTKPAYSDEFRTDAVNLLNESGRPLTEVARELGISANTLRFWRNRAIGGNDALRGRDRQEPGEDSKEIVAPNAEAETKRLRRENEYLRRQRDILKKAASILSEDPHLGMR